MSPASKKRKRPVSRQPRRHGSPSIAAAVLKAFAERADADGGPLQSELLLAHILGLAWEGSEWGRTDAAEALADEVIRANTTRHPGGGLALLAIARTGPAPVRERAQMAFESGLTSGAEWRMPDWADRIGTAQLGRTAIATDVYGDQTSYYLEFTYPAATDPEPHVLIVLVDYNLHLIKDMFVRVGPGIFEFLDEVRDDGEGTFFGPMDAQAAADDLWRHLDITDRTIGEVFGEESAETRYLLEARLDRLPPPQTDVEDIADVSDAERERLVSSFMRTRAVKELLTGTGSPDTPPERGSVRRIARLAIDYACDYGVGDPLRWSPTAVELFLTDWAPRKVNWEAEEVPWVPEVLDCLVAYCGGKSGLGARWIEETRDAVEEYGGDFLMLELEGSSKGPAAQIVASMLADGVDVTDERAVQAWIDRYNSML